MTASNSLANNTLLQDRYLVVRQLGQGGMGTVYEAIDQKFKSTVALKETLVSGDRLLQAFKREARLLNMLRHAALPMVMDYFAEADRQFLVMQFISGEDMAQRLKERGEPFPTDVVVQWGDQLLNALEYLHGHTPPIIHRDIKPQNIKLTRENEIVLLDFGLSKGLETDSLHHSSVHGYTPHYASFEQIQGIGTDQRSDLYSLAATLYHLLTNTIPPDSLERARVSLSKRSDPLLPADEINPRVPVSIARVIDGAMALDSDERPASAALMRKALREAARALIKEVIVPNVSSAEAPKLINTPLAPTRLSGSYSARIDRYNPSCFLFLVDQSGSMDYPIGGSTRRKADSLSDAINRMLSSLTIKCARSEGIRDYYDIGVIGYGEHVGSAFVGGLQGRSLVPISEVANTPAHIEKRTRKVDDGAGGLIETTIKFPVWIEGVANGDRPLCEAMRYAKRVLDDWIPWHQSSYPPIVFNITDGESTDGEPAQFAKELQNLSTSDGNTLVFNCYISATTAPPIIFPDNDAGLSDQYARQLFNMSSVLPEGIRNAARSEDFKMGDEARGFAFNADLEVLIRFLDIGIVTRPVRMR